MSSNDESIFCLHNQSDDDTSSEILLITQPEPLNTTNLNAPSKSTFITNKTQSRTKRNIEHQEHIPHNDKKRLHNDELNNSKPFNSFSIIKRAPLPLSQLEIKKQKVSLTQCLKIKIDSRVISFNQVIDENFTKLYSYLFGDNKESKLLYKTVIISKFSTLKSIKLDTDVFFTCQGECIAEYDPPIIKVNYDVDKTITLENCGKTKVNELISKIIEMTDVLFIRAISNGKVLQSEEVIEGDAVIDLI